VAGCSDVEFWHLELSSREADLLAFLEVLFPGFSTAFCEDLRFRLLLLPLLLLLLLLLAIELLLLFERLLEK
jgi:hypothetical protein